MARRMFKNNRKYNSEVGGAHVKKNPTRDVPYYEKNRSRMGQLQGRSVHRKATNMFSQYDTSAIEPKKSHVGRNIAIVVIIIVVVVAALLFLNSKFYFFGAPTRTDVAAGQSVEVTIQDGATTSEIASILYASGVISDEGYFKHVVSDKGVESQLRPGTYELTTLMDTDTLIDTLLAGPQFYGTKLVIPEGQTLDETASTVESTLGIKSDDFLKLAGSADKYASDYPFLSDAYDNSLEGYLFPKTYDVPDGATADDVIRMMLDQFQAEIESAGISTDGANGMTLAQLITIASMIEGETAKSDEMSKVASVIYNRLDNDMPLQIDATVIYALGDSYKGGSLTYDDLKVDSPYNTYENTGLPPGPICSPGIETIKAAANPSDTSYLYYLVTDDNGTHSFFDNYDDFLSAKNSR
ncbi:MAG: endolytic transglycosylase MltG [Coriobacteriales bacterium]|jgi:UPF0755 protein